MYDGSGKLEKIKDLLELKNFDNFEPNHEQKLG